jgi:hypothetical protein
MSPTHFPDVIFRTARRARATTSLIKG